MPARVFPNLLNQLELKVKDRGNGSFVAEFTHVNRHHDDLGALYYVIAVLFIYGFSIILMIASHVRKNKLDTKLRHYTKEMAKVRKSQRRMQCINILHATNFQEATKSQPQLVVTDSAGNEESSLITHSPRSSYTCLQQHRTESLPIVTSNEKIKSKNNLFPSALESKVRLDIPVHLPKKMARSGRRSSSPLGPDPATGSLHAPLSPDIRSPRTPDSLATSTSSISFWVGSDVDDSEISEPPSPRYYEETTDVDSSRSSSVIPTITSRPTDV